MEALVVEGRGCRFS